MHVRSFRPLRRVPWARVAAALLFAAGAAQLLFFARSVRFSPSPDYATVVLMARHMAAGTDFPAFFYGQAYMGSLEPAVSALLCALFGPSPTCVCLGTALFGLAVLAAAAWAGRRLAGPWGAALALFFLETTGYTWPVFMVSPHGGYALCALLVFGALAIPAFAPYPERGAPAAPLPAAPTAAFGFLAGLAFWNNWLAAPAFAAGGLVLLRRLRGRVFAPRFLLAFLLPFFFGSFPWWCWAFHHGWGALSLTAGGERPPGLAGLSAVLARQTARFWGLAADIPAFWRGPIPWLDLAAVLVGAAALALRRDAPARRFAAAVGLYALLFLFVYAFSSFGATDTARYLVPLSAPFAAVAGAGAAALAAARPARRRALRFAPAALALALVVSRAGVVAPASARVGWRQARTVAERGLASAAHWRAVAADPTLRGRPGFGEFTDFAANWMSDEALCVVSAKRWRYRPYLDALEACDDPWICGKYSGFEEFVRSSGGRCRVRSVHGLRVTDDLRPPPAVEPLPWDEAWTVRAADGRDVETPLFDEDWSSTVTLSADAEARCHVDLVLPSPVRILGVQALVDGELTARSWTLEGAAGPEDPLETLGASAAQQGWFWSGPRPYQFGPDERWELRWAPRAVSRLRLSFVARAPHYFVRLHGLRLLSEEPMPAFDLGRVVEAAACLRAAEAEPVRIHADRWLAAKLGAPPDPALEAGYGAGNLAREPSYSHSRVDFARPALVVVHGRRAAERTADVLARTGAAFGRVDAGGASLFRIPGGQPATNAALRAFLENGRVRFFADGLWLETRLGDPARRDAPALASVGGGLFDLVAAEPERAVARPGRTLPLRLDWRLGAGRNTLVPVRVFVHGLRDGKIAFQGQTLLFPEHVPGPRSLPRFWSDEVPLVLPPDLPPGDYALRIGFSPGVRSKRRYAVDTERPTRLRAVTLPATLRIDPAAAP